MNMKLYEEASKEMRDYEAFMSEQRKIYGDPVIGFSGSDEPDDGDGGRRYLLSLWEADLNDERCIGAGSVDPWGI